MKNSEKKKWEKPEVKGLSIKTETMSGATPFSKELRSKYPSGS